MISNFVVLEQGLHHKEMQTLLWSIMFVLISKEW